MRGDTDESLLSRVVGSGDERALSELYDRYGGLIHGAGVRYLGDRTLAEDLVQDVFLSVWRNAAGFDRSRASFATWIYRITRNRITDLARRRRARVRTIGPVAEEASPDPGDSAEEILRSFDVVGALSELGPAHREVLVLAYLGGLSQREISERTGVPLGTVKSRTTAALRAARERLLAPKMPGDAREDDRQHGRIEDGSAPGAERRSARRTRVDAGTARPVRDRHPGPRGGAGGRAVPHRMCRVPKRRARVARDPRATRRRLHRRLLRTPRPEGAHPQRTTPARRKPGGNVGRDGAGWSRPTIVREAGRGSGGAPPPTSCWAGDGLFGRSVRPAGNDDRARADGARAWGGRGARGAGFGLRSGGEPGGLGPAGDWARRVL